MKVKPKLTPSGINVTLVFPTYLGIHSFFLNASQSMCLDKPLHFIKIHRNTCLRFQAIRPYKTGTPTVLTHYCGKATEYVATKSIMIFFSHQFEL